MEQLQYGYTIDTRRKEENLNGKSIKKNKLIDKYTIIYYGDDNGEEEDKTNKNYTIADLFYIWKSSLKTHSLIQSRTTHWNRHTIKKIQQKKAKPILTLELGIWLASNVPNRECRTIRIIIAGFTSNRNRIHHISKCPDKEYYRPMLSSCTNGLAAERSDPSDQHTADEQTYVIFA